MKIVQLMGGARTVVSPPIQDEGVERWGLNNLYLCLPLRARFAGWTRWFDLHTSEHIKARKGGNINCYPWLCKQTKPIYRWAVDPDMPASVKYPLAAMQGSRALCSSLDWMLALAIYEQFTHIELFGWRLSHPAYTHQKETAQWWIRKAQAQDIEVSVLGRSSLSSLTSIGKVVLPKSSAPVVEIPIPRSCLLYGLETTDRSKIYHAK